MTTTHTRRSGQAAHIEPLEPRTLLSGAIASVSIITAEQLAAVRLDLDVSIYDVPFAPENPPIIETPAPTPEPALPSPELSYEWTKLFNGVDLDGFYTYTESQGIDNDTAGYFKVADGSIHATDLPDGETVDFGYIATNESYSNFHLRFQYQWGGKKFAPRASVVRDAGLLFYMNGTDQLWPMSVETQIQENDTGDLWLLGSAGKEASAKVTVTDADANLPKYKVGGETMTQQGGRIVKSALAESLTSWNTVEVFADGQRATVVVNGTVVMRMTDIAQPDPEDPSKLIPLTSGKIAFQTEGAEVFYRDIEIRSLNAVNAPNGASTIFDGSDTTAFVPRADEDADTIDWTVKDGAMTVKPGSGDIVTREHFEGDYRLHLEFRTNPKRDSVREQDRGNSGIGLAGSYEVQVLDSYDRAIDGMNDLGAIYGVANPAVNAALPAGVWQAYDIDFTAAQWLDGEKTADARISVWLNGTLIHDDVAMPESTFTFEPEQAGPQSIIFQDHGNTVSYRNIWIMPA